MSLEIVSIRELARRAGLMAPYGSDREGLANFDYRKFAELIIEECTKVVDEYFEADEPWMKPSDVTKHFKD